MTSLWIFLAAWLLRASFLFFSLPVEDPRWSPHWNLSTGLLTHGTLGYQGERVTNIEPGYPAMLALFRFLFQDQWVLVFLAQTAVSALGVLGLYGLTHRLTQNKTVALFAGCFYAVYPYFIGQSIAVIEVPLITTLLVICAYSWVRVYQTQRLKDAILCGLVFGLTFLTRSMVLPCLLLSLFCLFLQKKTKAFLAASAFLLLVMLPWMIRSFSVDGSIIPPRSGWNFMQGNCPYSDKIIPRYNPDLLDAYASQVLEQERPDLANAPDRETLGREVDHYFNQKAAEFIRQHPGRFLALKIKNIFYLFSPRIVPYESMNRDTRIHFTGPESFTVTGIARRGWLKETSHLLAYGGILLLSAGGIWLRRARWREDIFFYLLAANFTAVYALYWPATRLRAPMDFVFMFFAAVFLTARMKQNPAS